MLYLDKFNLLNLSNQSILFKCGFRLSLQWNNNEEIKNG